MEDRDFFEYIRISGLILLAGFHCSELKGNINVMVLAIPRCMFFPDLD
jgi:hypothetical protein